MGNRYLRHGSSISEGGARDNMGNYYSSQDSSMMLEFCIRGRGGWVNMGNYHPDQDSSVIMCWNISGGDEDGTELGFLGCMRNLEIGSESIDDILTDQNYGVLNGTCSIQDK